MLKMYLWKIFKERQYNASQILSSLGVSSPPINPIDICNIIGVSLYSANFNDDRSGCLLWGNKQPKIYFNRNDSEFRQRFIVAHELGHILLGIFINQRVFQL
jgi:Zn-dependent peptidase ImmA (M78 family)